MLRSPTAVSPNSCPSIAVAPWILSAVLSLSSVSHARDPFIVNSTVDAGDAAPGDGVCDSGTGACTLRAAVQETNALEGFDVIVLPAGTYLLTIPGHDETAT